MEMQLAMTDDLLTDGSINSILSAEYEKLPACVPLNVKEKPHSTRCEFIVCTDLWEPLVDITAVKID